MHAPSPVVWKVPVNRLLVLLFAAAIFLSAMTDLLGLDIWWHLAVGRHLVQTRSFPARDNISTTGAAWDNKEWLFGIFVYLLHQAGGVGLMTLAKAALFTAVFLVLYLVAAKRSKNRYLSLAVVFLAALACRVRLAFRPELFSWLFIALLLLFIEQFREGRRRPLCFFPLLMLCWVNVHPLAFVGLGILAVCLAGGIAVCLLPGHAERNGWQRLRPGDLAGLALIFAASCLAFTCNPISWRRFLSPLELLTKHSDYLGALTEAAPLPLFQFPAFASFVLLAVFTLVMFVTSMDPADTLLVVLSGAASVAMARNAPLLPVVAAPAIACQFARFIGPLAPEIAAYLSRRRTAADAVVAALLVAAMAWAVRRPGFGLGYGGIVYPEGAVRYVETAKPLGPIFNSYDWGGFLIWRIYPGYRVFIDGRGPDVYSPEVWAEYETIESAREGWEEALDRRGVNLVLVSTAEKLHPLIRALSASGGWRLGYWDLHSMVFLRDVPGNRPRIAAVRYAVLDTERMRFRGWDPSIELQILGELDDYLKEHPESVEARGLLALTYLNRGMEDRAIEEFERLAAANPALPRIHYNLGMLRSRTGDDARAAADYEKEIALDDSFAPAHNNLGRIRFERGDLRLAERSFRKALKADPNYIHAINNLGLVYLEQEDATRALAEFSRALEIDPAYEPAARNIALAREISSNPARTLTRMGQFYYAQDNLDKAERLFIRALSHDPRHAAAIGNLGVVALRRGMREEAIRRFREVLEIAPDDEGARRHLALAEAMAAGGGPSAAPPLSNAGSNAEAPAPPAPPGGGR